MTVERAALVLGITAFVACAGCTSWSRLNDGQPVPARHSLPDTARRTVANTTIDSLRIQTTDAGKTLIVGSGVAIALLLAFAQGLSFK